MQKDRIKSKIIKAYKNKDYVLIKNAIDLKSFGLNFDFNSLLEFFNTYPSVDQQLGFKGHPFLGQIWNVVNEDTALFFSTYLVRLKDILKDTFKYNFGNLDFFFSLQGVRGGSHTDTEHVIILGIYKNTYYHIKGKDIKICPGDMLYISKGNIHHAFSSTERIVLSISIWEKN
jgi:hypothetical protein